MFASILVNSISLDYISVAGFMQIKMATNVSF